MNEGIQLCQLCVTLRRGVSVCVCAIITIQMSTVFELTFPTWDIKHCICHFGPGLSDEVWSFGSVDYWLRLRIPMTETIRLYKEKVKALGYINTALSGDAQVPFTLELFKVQTQLIFTPLLCL